MKCKDCAEYEVCSRKYDLRSRRRTCGKTNATKCVAMEGNSMTKDEITRALRICGKKMGCGHCPGKGLQDPLGERLCTELLMLRAAALIEQQEARITGLEAKVPRWIPVTEKIPPDQEEVLVLTRSKNGVRNVDKGYWAIDHFIHRGRAVVTHWMPLPGWPEVQNG